jgi:hypothetical protein
MSFAGVCFPAAIAGLVIICSAFIVNSFTLSSLCSFRSIVTVSYHLMRTACYS